MRSRISVARRWVAIALLAAGYAATASAHTQGGVLGKKADAIDVYTVNCYDDGQDGPPDRLLVEIMDRLPVKPPLVQATVQSPVETRSTMDPKDGDKSFSPEISVAGGAGPYKVTISKVDKPGKGDNSRKYPEIYELEFHCWSTIGAHTGTDISGPNPNQ